MKCRSVKENLSHLLADDVSSLPPEITLHLDSCEGCKAFHRAESQIVVKMNAELHAMVNWPVPPSLLPRVRQQLEGASPEPSRISVLVPGAAASAIGLLILATLLPRIASRIEHPAIQAQAGLENLQEKELSQSKPIGNFHPPNREGNDSLEVPEKATRPEKKEPPSVEVLVSRDEFSGFVALRTAIYREPRLGKAILHPVAQSAEDSQRIAPESIAPLDVSDLEIQPLVTKDDDSQDPTRSDMH